MKALLAIALALVPVCAWAPSKGDGAARLIQKRLPVKKVASGVPPLPSMVIAPKTNYPTYYFAVVAYNTNGLESSYSNEASYTRRSATNTSVTLAWDPSTNAAGYRLYVGRAPSTYTNVIDAGLSTQAVYYLPRPPTNLVVTVRTDAENLATQKPFGKWTPLSPRQSSISLTNPTGPIYYRSYGNGSPVSISSRWY